MLDQAIADAVRQIPYADVSEVQDRDALIALYSDLGCWHKVVAAEQVG